MTRFHAKNGQFWLNDQPQLIQAGEFHYYRTSRDQWRHRLGLLQAAGFNTLASYIPWLWHQVEEDGSDFDGHSHPMRDLAGFLNLAAEMGFWIIARPGPYIMAETINEGIPSWIFDKYPQVAFISQDHKAQNIASYLHPDFLNMVRKWYRAIFEVLTPRQVTRGGKIIMIQLDNEMGMMPWVRNIMDINPHTVLCFAKYLRDTYGKDLSSRYQNDNLEEFITQGIASPEEQLAQCLVDDYKRFYRDYLREYASFLWSEARSCGMDVLPVINIHGFMNGGKTFPIGLSQLVSVMRIDGMVSATDVYPGVIGEGNFHELLFVNEATKAIQNEQQALFSIEFQSGGINDFSNGQSSLYDLHTRLCISSGMRAINHYLFCSGENDPILSPVKRHDWGHPVRMDGTLRRHYLRYPKLSKVLNTYGKDLILAKPQVVATIGFLLDYFMTEVNNEYTRNTTNIITHQRDVVLFDMIAKGLAVTNRAFNAVELSGCKLDVTQSPVCWVMMEKQCHSDVQQKLVDYVKSGGRLILAGRMCVEDFNHEVCTILMDALEIERIESDVPFASSEINAFQYCDIPVSFVETYSGKFDEIFAWRKDGEVVGFIKSIGRGKVIMFGAAMSPVTLEDFDIVHQMALKMDCQTPFKLSDWADIRLSQGENGSFLFINNYQDDPLETKIEYDHEVMFGGNPVCIPARQGQILPIEWQADEGVFFHYSTSEIVDRLEDESTILFKTSQNEFFVELMLSGYSCDDSVVVASTDNGERVKLHGRNGEIKLRKRQ